MTISFSIDENNDLYLDASGNLAVSSGLRAVLEICEQVCKTQLGELVLDTTAGIPALETVWSGSPNVLQFEAAIKQAILSVPDVIGIPVVSFLRGVNKDPSLESQSNDVLSYRAIIQTIYGQGTINGQL